MKVKIMEIQKSCESCLPPPASGTAPMAWVQIFYLIPNGITKSYIRFSIIFDPASWRVIFLLSVFFYKY
ncbi:MAG: hypothetical protein L0Y79_09895 [Chlorobi bacterium]|nr:hypothetical protein [Chlorobiota bacterium]